VIKTGIGAHVRFYHNCLATEITDSCGRLLGGRTVAEKINYDVRAQAGEV
jgi:hypothetical protein